MARKHIYQGWIQGDRHVQAKEGGNVCRIYSSLLERMLIVHQCSPEAMGAVCAVVYLLCVIMFIPFPFYRDIVAATSGGGNRDLVIEAQHIETGRFLHKFPHNKVDLP